MGESSPEDLDRYAAEQAQAACHRLLAAAGAGGNEADFRREVALILTDAGVSAGLTLSCKDEFCVARGRVDSVYNRLVVEYKRPGGIHTSNKGGHNQRIIQQVQTYVLDVATRERREAHRLAGVAVDGFHFIFVRRVGDGWSVDEPVPVTQASTERFLRLLFSLSAGAALVPENLLEDFGPRTLRAQRAVRALYTTLHSSKHPLVVRIFEQWRLFYSEATDYGEWAEHIESKKEFRGFVKGMGLDPKYVEAAKVFFALHTYYALLIKLVASLAAARFAGGGRSPLSEAARKQGPALQEAFADLERGEPFRQYGIRNFLEGDFFGWYLAAWDAQIEEATSTLVQRLADYDPGTLELAPENARDLLKKLYHYLLPREIRHDLGEYYTPDWLAERLVIQTLGPADLGDASKRVLDPACGSGTFLVILIKYIRDRASRLNDDPGHTLALILNNVVGIDLNPLAVIAARTNYLLALGDLLKARKSDIDIPVYQADSVLAPSQSGDVFAGPVYPLKTAVGLFQVPAAFASRERMDVLTNALDEAVVTAAEVDTFVARVASDAKLRPEDISTVGDGLKELYKQIRELHEQGLNGVWARIIKNAFAPLFLELSDYVVGNPPWVNWEHLPDEYRRSTRPLWDRYGLFPKRAKAMETILGAAKYDISMLMTYVAVDRYLRPGGQLGFVLPQTLFKTAAAGQGFRRFLLPDKTPFGAVIVEDMVDLKPFEGAANRTAVAVFGKGRPIRYPVSYQYWKRRAGRAGRIGFDTPYEDITKERITFRAWQGKPVDATDVTSAWITARPGCLRVLDKIIGPSDYVGRKGITCGVNGVFWLSIHATRPGGDLIVANVPERGKKVVSATQAAVEPALVYPLLRGMDVSRWMVRHELSVLLTHKPGMRLKAIPEGDMQREYPKAWQYLTRYRTILRQAAIFRRFFRPSDPFYSVFNVGDYTFAPHKVLIREIAGSLTSAVAADYQGKPSIPDHKLVLVACDTSDEAHFLCAALNSRPAMLLAQSYGITTQFSTHIFRLLRISRFQPGNQAHVHLASLSRQAHQAAELGEAGRLTEIETQIDDSSRYLWNLTQDDLKEIGRGLEDI